MIVLNREKEIVRVEQWTDITERPGFSGTRPQPCSAVSRFEVGN